MERRTDELEGGSRGGCASAQAAGAGAHRATPFASEGVQSFLDARENMRALSMLMLPETYTS